jgi:hypothetical protein
MAKKAGADKPPYVPFKHWKAAVAASVAIAAFLVGGTHIAGKFFGPFGGLLGLILFPFLMLFDAVFFHGCWYIGGVANEYGCPGNAERIIVYFFAPLAIYLLITGARFVIAVIMDDDDEPTAKERKNGGRRK